MANILVVDNQQWVVDICKEVLAGQGHQISTTDDIETVRKNVSFLNIDVVLLNLYLKYGYLVWDVLKDIKRQNPFLPVIIVTLYDTNLYNHHLDQADGFFIKKHCTHVKLNQKIDSLLACERA